MKLFFLCFACFVTVHCFAQKNLNYNMSVGDTFTVSQKAYQHITQSFEGIDQVVENDLEGVMRFEVLESSATDYKMSMTFKRLKMVMSSPSLGELSNSDTESTDSTNVTNLLFKGILDIPVTIVMSKNGKILSVNGGDKLIESMLATAGIDQPEIVEASKAEMEKQFGSQALSNSFEQMTYVYPDSPVEIGSEWTNSYHGDLSVQNNWKLDSVTDDSINISGMANTKMSTIDENISMTLLGSQKTTIIADSKTGLFKEIVITGENSGDTLYSKQNFSVPTVIKSTITYKTSN